MDSEPSCIEFLHDTITQAEILLGVELLPKGKRRSDLALAAEALFDRVFAGRILPFDGDAARALPGIATRRRRIGRPIADYDAQIAAIALSRAAEIATRDAAGFAQLRSPRDQSVGSEVVR